MQKISDLQSIHNMLKMIVIGVTNPPLYYFETLYAEN